MLTDFWFGVIAALWAGFFLLEGFDFGVGILLPLLARTESQRVQALRTIGPTWDGNEVWLLVAGGATFAAFPSWYAELFSGLYLPLAAVLVGLIIRGISIEYRGKVATAAGRAWCDRGMVIGSLLPAVLLGVAFADLIRGLKLDVNHHVTGNLLDLVTPFGLLGGLTTLGLFAYHGSVFVALRADGELHRRARRIATELTGPVAVVTIAFLAWSFHERHTPVSVAMSVVLVLAFVASAAANGAGRPGWAFAASALVSLGAPVFVLSSLWPYVIPAHNVEAWSLTVQQASSSHYTLVVMTVVALIFTPVVIAYQAWAYWVFRSRVTDAGAPRLPRPAPGRSANDAYLVIPGGGDGRPAAPGGTGGSAPAGGPAGSGGPAGAGGPAGPGAAGAGPAGAGESAGPAAAPAGPADGTGEGTGEGGSPAQPADTRS